MTIHIVYPFGPRAAAPWSIGNHLAWAARKAGHVVRQYDWEAPSVDSPSVRPGDVLLGHPHPSEARAFDYGLALPFSQRIAIAPWNGADEYTIRLSKVLDRVDCAFAICGPYWARRFPAVWADKVKPLDMAIDPVQYPRLKPKLAAPGKRRYLYVGCTLPCKGTAYLELVIAATGGEWGHIGPGAVAGCREHGYLPLETDAGRQIVAGYDFLVMPGANDANPTVVLEAECWGLVPVVTATSGWEGRTILPPDVTAAAALLNHMQHDPALEPPPAPGAPYDWDTFTSSVMNAIHRS